MPIHDLFYHIVLDTYGPFLETKFSNKYILVAIDHYSKWCETKVVPNEIAPIVATFVEEGECNL
jgi:hypothetical protein